MSESVTLMQIVAALRVTYTDPGIALWLGTPHRALGRRAPWRAIADGDIGLVADVVATLAGDCDPRAMVIR